MAFDCPLTTSTLTPRRGPRLQRAAHCSRVATSASESALSQVAASWNQHCAPPSRVVSCSSIIGAGLAEVSGLPTPLPTCTSSSQTSTPMPGPIAHDNRMGVAARERAGQRGLTAGAGKQQQPSLPARTVGLEHWRVAGRNQRDRIGIAAGVLPPVRTRPDKIARPVRTRSGTKHWQFWKPRSGSSAGARVPDPPATRPRPPSSPDSRGVIAGAPRQSRRNRVSVRCRCRTCLAGWRRRCSSR